MSRSGKLRACTLSFHLGKNEVDPSLLRVNDPKQRQRLHQQQAVEAETTLSRGLSSKRAQKAQQ